MHSAGRAAARAGAVCASAWAGRSANLLAAIVIYWNTLHLGHAVAQRQSDGLSVPPELLAHISPLGWAHILLTGEYRWPRTVADTPYSVI